MKHNTNDQLEDGKLPSDIVERIHLLSDKYGAMGQDMKSYLDGLLYADYLTYWDYIHLDVLLSLQNPKTPFEDEKIFIIYHQITELYFKLILNAIRQVANSNNLTIELFIRQLKRCNSYFDNLVNSFEIMIEGMDKEEFLKFRMSLLPASGFQSAQYRMIEICSTDIDNIIAYQYREDLNEEHADMRTKYQYLYWKQGAVELATKKKTLTLKQFEKKYSDDLIDLAQKYEHKNLWVCYQNLSEEDQYNTALINELRQFDVNANVNWPLMHYKSAVRYLQRETKDIAATGGTNWQKYLPPKNQHILFYPSLWSDEEKENWGKRLLKKLLE